MSPSRLAFVQEFERQLSSDALQEWFDAVRRRDVPVANFSDPSALRRFLHSHDRADSRKPEIWRTLVRELQAAWTPEAVTFLLGLLEPALGNLVDNFHAGRLDADELWQEAILGALQALENPRVPTRSAVLAGLVRDTLKHLCAWLRVEFSKGEDEAPLLGLTYETDFDEPLDGIQGEILLKDWCRRAGISSDQAAVIFTTRIVGLPLSRSAPARSRRYNRLLKRRGRAEARLKVWLIQKSRPAGPSKIRCPKTAPGTGLLKGDARTGHAEPDQSTTSPIQHLAG